MSRCLDNRRDVPPQLTMGLPNVILTISAQ
jgi:hypothetical protein